MPDGRAMEARRLPYMWQPMLTMKAKSQIYYILECMQPPDGDEDILELFCTRSGSFLYGSSDG